MGNINQLVLEAMKKYPDYMPSVGLRATSAIGGGLIGMGIHQHMRGQDPLPLAATGTGLVGYSLYKSVRQGLDHMKKAQAFYKRQKNEQH